MATEMSVITHTEKILRRHYGYLWIFDSEHGSNGENSWHSGDGLNRSWSSFLNDECSICKAP